MKWLDTEDKILIEIVLVLWCTHSLLPHTFQNTFLSVGLLRNRVGLSWKWTRKQQREEEAQGSRIQRETTPPESSEIWGKILRRTYEVGLAYVG